MPVETDGCMHCVFGRPYEMHAPWACDSCGVIHGVPCSGLATHDWRVEQELRAAEIVYGERGANPFECVGWWSWVAGCNMGNFVENSWAGWLAAEMTNGELT